MDEKTLQLVIEEISVKYRKTRKETMEIIREVDILKKELEDNENTLLKKDYDYKNRRIDYLKTQSLSKSNISNGLFIAREIVLDLIDKK